MTPIKRRAALGLAAALPFAAGAHAQARPLKIGILTDLSGIVADMTGRGSVLSAQLAAAEFGGTVAGRRIEILSADHQHKPDVGLAIARQWFDDGVDVIADLPNSAVALAVQELGRERGKIILHSAAGTTALTNAQCAPLSFHWAFDTYGLAHAVAAAVLKQGGDTWFTITADYAFGTQLEKDVTSVVVNGGGKMLGSARHPLGATDYASYLVAAQASRAKVIGICNAGNDTVNLLKQANEFGIIRGGQQLATTLLTVIDVHGMGLKAAQGVLASEAFYWDRDEATRAWSKPYFTQFNRAPSAIQIGTWEAIRSYLQACAALGTTDATAVAAKLHATEINSIFTHAASIRGDGRVLRPMLLMRVKAPEDSKYPWDYMHIEGEVPANEVVWPVSESTCKLLKT